MTSDDLEGLGVGLAKATFQQFGRAVLKIEDERGLIVPFELNEAQLEVYREIKRQEASGRAIRILILKGRQQGMSTLCQMRLLWRMLTRPGSRCQTVGHNLAGIHELYGKVDRGIRELPDFLRPDLEPGGERGRRMRFADPLRSSYRGDSAADPEQVGRGTTIQYAHLTEIPQWARPDETMQAVLATIPDYPDTEIYVETTAKGASGWFYETWIDSIRAVERGEEPEFVPVFVPWFKTARYARKQRPGEPPLDRNERAFKKQYGLTDEQVLWYRDQRKRFGERVTEEYPSSWEEAFLSSGLPFFRRDSLEFYRERRREPDRKGHFRLDRETGKASFELEAFGPTWVFSQPVPEHRYSVGVDFASGRARDYSTIVVIDVDGKEIVATHQSKLLPDDVLTEAVALARIYNDAIIVPERSGIGQSPVDRLVNEWGYPNVYRETDTVRVRKQRGARFGFATSVGTRRWLLEDMAHVVHTRAIDIPCSRLVDEMQSFVYTDDEGDHAAAGEGSHDDLVMGFAIALRGFTSAPPKKLPEFDAKGDRIKRSKRSTVISRRAGY